MNFLALLKMGIFDGALDTDWPLITFLAHLTAGHI